MKSLIFVFLLLPVCIFSQAELLFESVLHVEDAMGNRDSVEFGYALNEEPNVFNPELGEEELFTPFDSVLEMRGFTLDNYTSSMNIGMSKRVISHVLEKSFNENENCYVIQGNVVFMVNAKYLPVTFSWNHEDFNSVRCLEAATFSTHLAGATVDGWWLEPWLAEESVCASVNNNFSTSLPNIEGFEVVKDVEIEDAGIKTIRGIALGYAVSSWLPTWCSIDTSLTISTSEVFSEPALSVYPNPVSEILHTDLPNQEEFMIVDIIGRVLLRGYGQQVDVSFLPQGIYFIKSTNRRARKFVKE
jgi:hypothetical protein